MTKKATNQGHLKSNVTAILLLDELAQGRYVPFTLQETQSVSLFGVTLDMGPAEAQVFMTVGDTAYIAQMQELYRTLPPRTPVTITMKPVPGLANYVRYANWVADANT